jgi:hypothetical protein
MSPDQNFTQARSRWFINADKLELTRLFKEDGFHEMSVAAKKQSGEGQSENP